MHKIPTVQEKYEFFFDSTSQQVNESTSFWGTEGAVSGLFRGCSGAVSGL